MKIVIITFNFHGRKGKPMKRKEYLTEIEHGFRSAKIVAILGPRQCGKTTLARLLHKKIRCRGLIEFLKGTSKNY